MRYIKYIVFVWIILQSCFTHAQQYPVDVQTFVTPPYPQNLRGYWDTFEPKIQTHLLLKDLSSPMRNVTLHFSLENLQGQVITQSASYALPFQTQLTAGVRKTLSNLDFKAVFALENLSGISENFYNDLLPEGTYFFCFTVYDITTQTPISNKSRAMVQIRRYTPPLLTLPARGEIIPKRNNFQHIVFQWAMRDPAPFTQYEFTLKEVWDNSLAPDEAFLSGRLIYQGNVSSNTILYGTDKPFLIENKRYAWRVRAFTNNPNNPNQTVSYFKNNGESETFVFDYIANCEAPKFLIASPQANTANIRWQSGGSPQTINTNGSLYKVLYREKGKAWKSVSASMPNATLSGLKRGKNYIYKVGIACGLDNPLNNSAFNEQTYLYSTEQEFTTTDRISDSLSVQCGVKPQIRIKNREPLQEVLGVNDTFMAGDFPVTVLHATGGNGVFSGEGYVQVPYLLDTKIKVKFEGITLNTERQLVAGKLVTTYDKLEGNVAEVDIIQTIDDAIKSLENIFKKQEQIIKEVEKLEIQLSNNINSEKTTEIQQKLEEENKKWQEEQIKIVKIAHFVASSPAISEKEKEELEKKAQESKNATQKISSQNLKKSTQSNKNINEIAKNVHQRENKNIAETKEKLEKFPKTKKICEDWVQKSGKFGRFELNYNAYQQCTHGTLYRLENSTYIFHTQYNLYHTLYQNEPPQEHFYIYVADIEDWVEFIPERRKFQRGEMPQIMKDIIFGAVDFWIPLEDGTVLLTGKNLQGEDKNRVAAAGLFIVNISAGKIVKIVKGAAKVVGKGIKYIGDEAVKIAAKNIGKVDKIWDVFPKIKNKLPISTDGWLMGRYVNGVLEVVDNTKIAQTWDYIITTKGEILVGRRHSWLSKGNDVLAAGELKFRNGKLVDINNASGHYLPSIKESSNFLKIFKQAGVDIKQATLTILKENGTIYKQIPPNSKERMLYIK